jgi:MFS family permease
MVREEAHLMAEGNVTSAPEAQVAGGGQAPSPPPLPSLKTAYTSLLVLTIVVMFTVLDRQILALLIDPIKKDFNITDTQAALLLGLAFSLSYAIAGFPIARAADTWNRRNLVAFSLALWSGATVLSGLAQNYVQLFVARLVVGAGESGYGPATWAIVADSFPREKVAFGVGTLAIGATVGTGMAMFFGGAVLGMVEHWPTVSVPIIGVIRPWQWAFMLVGLPGLLWAAVVMMTHEPARRVPAGASAKKPSISDVFAHMGRHWRPYTASVGGIGMKYLVTLGSNQWMPTLFHREFDWSLSKIGLLQGSITIISAPIGMLCGAKLSEHWIKRGRSNANIVIALISMCVTIPMAIIMPMLPRPEMILVCMSVSFFMFSVGAGPGIAAFQLITPGNIRAQVGAICQFSSNVIAFTLGPLFVALFTDYVFKDPLALKYSMSCVAAIFGPIAIFTVWQGLKPYSRSIERMNDEMAA